MNKNRINRLPISPPLVLLLTGCLLFWPFSQIANSEEKQQICVYRTAQGKEQRVDSITKVPYALRKNAHCVEITGGGYLAKPQEIDLTGNIRREDISSALGRMRLRWPRTAEVMFGRTPLRAMTDAARTVSRTLKTASFPTHLQNINVEWDVIFLDEKLPAAQIPPVLISNCHPGWMTPPANIYIVAQRVAQGCQAQQTASASVADSRLTEVLLHEMGHVVEYYLLPQAFSKDRMRAEGFATWFALYAAQYSSLANQKNMEREVYAQAKLAIKNSPHSFNFSGDSLDYSRASMYFSAIVSRRGVRGLIDVYRVMNQDGSSFFAAIEKALLWDRKTLEKEVARLLGLGQ